MPLISGRYDYLLKVATAGVSDYQEPMERPINSDLGIDKYFSFVVMKSPVVKRHLPLRKIFPL